MYKDKVYVLVQYKKQAIPVVAYSRPLAQDPANAWKDVENILREKLKPRRKADPLVTVYAPPGVVPRELLAYRWKASPSGTDVLHLGNLALV